MIDLREMMVEEQKKMLVGGGGGGRFYWGRKEEDCNGIVVAFVWLFSQERYVRPYVELYASLGWNSIICHSNFLNLFFPEKATTLALGVLTELVKELKRRPCPVVFASFSGGTKTCLYKALQIIRGSYEEHSKLVEECVSGQMFDSCPVDFTSDIGTKFVLHPTVLKTSNPPKLVSWAAKAISSSLDSLFLHRFESQRAEHWQTLYASTGLGPFLIFCSEDDDIVPCQTICNFAKKAQDVGGDVKLVKWRSSPHVGHYKHHRDEYKAAVTEFLTKSALIYSKRISRTRGESSGVGNASEEISKSICNLHKAATRSNQSFQRVAIEASDHFFLPSSAEIFDNRGDDGSVQAEQRGSAILVPNPPILYPQGVLGEILFDVCVPKNVDGWDLKSIDMVHGKTFPLARKNNPLNPIKCIRRSRL